MTDGGFTVGSQKITVIVIVFIVIIPIQIVMSTIQMTY